MCVRVCVDVDRSVCMCMSACVCICACIGVCVWRVCVCVSVCAHVCVWRVYVRGGCVCVQGVCIEVLFVVTIVCSESHLNFSDSFMFMFLPLKFSSTLSGFLWLGEKPLKFLYLTIHWSETLIMFEKHPFRAVCRQMCDCLMGTCIHQRPISWGYFRIPPMLAYFTEFPQCIPGGFWMASLRDRHTFAGLLNHGIDLR